jgi:hypothetical protein
VESTLVGIVQCKSRSIGKIMCQRAVQLRILKVKSSSEINRSISGNDVGYLAMSLDLLMFYSIGNDHEPEDSSVVLSPRLESNYCFELQIEAYICYFPIQQLVFQIHTMSTFRKCHGSEAINIVQVSISSLLTFHPLKSTITH